MTYFSEILDKNIWRQFTFNYEKANFLQSWNWGEFQQSLGKKIFRIGIFKQKQLRGVFLLIKQAAKRGTYLECPGGPLIFFEDPELWEKFIKIIKIIGKLEKCSFIRVRPQLFSTLANRLLFQKQGFIAAPMHLHAENTLQLDLRKKEEQLLGEMRKNTRYLVRRAIKEGVKIVSGGEDDIEVLYQLQLETVGRRHFVPFDREYFRKEFCSFIKDKEIKLFKACYLGKVLSAALIIFYHQEAVYHYSGSSSQFRKIPASYLLQWEAIKEAKKRGCLTYNFWGIAPAKNIHHRFAGVTLFKKGFGGEEVNYLHAHDLPLKPNYWLIYIFESLRKFYRRL